MTFAPANLCRHLETAANESPQALAVAVQRAHSHFLGLGKPHFSYQEINFSQLHKASDEIAFVLNEQGIVAGMKAVLMVSPSLEFFTLTFALFKAGIVPILVDPGMGMANLKLCFQQAQPQVFIGIPKAHIARQVLSWGEDSLRHCINVGGGSLARLLSGAPSLDELIKDSPKRKIKTYPIVKLDEHAMAAILFTSGSTGLPKGVVYSHSMFEAQITALKTDYGIKPGERDLATFPLFSLFGPALGMASIVPDMDASKPITAKPGNLFAAIDKYQCTNLFVNPALLERLGKAGEESNQSLVSVKRVISAGAPASIDATVRFAKMLAPHVPVLNSYGATESLPISYIASHELIKTAQATDNGAGICVGKAITGVDIKIITIDEDPIDIWTPELALGTNQMGEIVVQGPMVSQAYYLNDSATKLAKIAEQPMTDDNELVRYRHRMGDLGYLDDSGNLWMCGRKAHRVEANLGSEASPAPKTYLSIPCERVFNTHPQVLRSALVGIEVNGVKVPLICIELDSTVACNNANVLYQALKALAQNHEHTQGIGRFLIHPSFPVDVRHNAKIFREKLAVWAQAKWKE
jgi:acyl-coenzyme A synthetase/AMP-(fatty) acid ligase